MNGGGASVLESLCFSEFCAGIFQLYLPLLALVLFNPHVHRNLASYFVPYIAQIVVTVCNEYNDFFIVINVKVLHIFHIIRAETLV